MQEKVCTISYIKYCNNTAIYSTFWDIKTAGNSPPLAVVTIDLPWCSQTKSCFLPTTNQHPGWHTACSSGHGSIVHVLT